MSHTPGPWFVFPRSEDGLLHIGPGAHSVAKVLRADDEQANADRIVHCVNCHDDLVEGLRLLLIEVEASGNARAKDFGWPAAVKSATAAFDKATSKADSMRAAMT